MQFKIRMTGPMPDIGVIEDAISAVDPSVLVDVDPTGQTLRVASSIDADELIGLMNQAGCRLSPHHLERVPSECCGGCGG
jgi:hypothetical protein